MTDLATTSRAPSRINPKLIHGLHSQFDRTELARLRAGLALVPGEAGGEDEIWRKFERDEATVFYGRNEAREIAFFFFVEVRHDTRTGAREMFLEGALALQGSRTIVDTTFPQIENFARMLRCHRVALQTARLGLVKKLLSIPGWFIRGMDGEEFLLAKKLRTV